MKDQQGNALFLILIAVALFAALSYAVTNSGRGGAGIDKEQADIAAAEIFNYTALVDQTIMRLRINGCALREINFENSIVSNYAPHFYPRTDNSCSVFDANGGGLSWKEVPADWLEDATTRATYESSDTDAGHFNFPRSVCVTSSTLCTDPEDKDLVIGLKFLRKGVCDALNDKLGLTTNSSAAAISPAGDSGRYLGLFYSPGGYRTTSDEDAQCMYLSLIHI